MYSKLTSHVKSVIFDMDGTLIDTLYDIADSVNFVLRKYKYPQHSYVQYKNFIGDGIESLVLRSLPKNIKLDHKKIFKEIKSKYQENLNSKTVVYKGIIEILDFLSLKNIQIGICTNKPHQSAIICSEKYFNKYNILTLGAGHKFNVKPDPEGVLNLLNQLKVSPSRSLFVGDSDIDIFTAKNAGIPSVGVLWGFRHEKELIDAGADFTFKKPKDFLIFLKSIIL